MNAGFKVNPELHRKIVIIGLPASGKTTLSEWMTDLCPDHTIFHTDDYIEKHTYEAALYALMADMKARENDPMIIEGVQGYRLLRKGLELESFAPDLIIICEAAPELREVRMRSRGKKELPVTFDKNLEGVYLKYLDALEKSGRKPPEFITFRSEDENLY